jgi:two-component system chemotaxis response regulator CheB
MRAESGGKYQAIVVGVSLGGDAALHILLSTLPANFPLPIIIVRHLSKTSDNIYFVEKFKEYCRLDVREAEEKELIEKGCVYVAPASYHLLIEEDRTFSLSVDELVNYSRPSIDVLFESAAEVYSSGLIGIILTGANSDGASGLKSVKEKGGLAIVQEPDTAVGRDMPESAIKACRVDHILPLHEMPELLLKIVNMKSV